MADQTKGSGDKKIRAWVDGFWDMAHFGHANFLRQAKQLTDVLVVGIHTDETAVENKGLPAYTYPERLRMLKAIRWVDEVVEDAPYATMVETLDKYNCDFAIHGDDISVGPDGQDSWKSVKDAGRFRDVPRTNGISTTSLIGRLLLNTRSNEEEMASKAEAKSQSPYSGESSYMTSGLISQFYESRRKPSPDDKVVYVSGAFDVFHIGHLAFLEAAAAQGTYLIVGIHPNETVTAYKGPHRPLMSLHERVLGVLGFRCVDDVIIGAPFEITGELIDQFKISVVCHGSRSPVTVMDGKNPYEEAKRRGIFKIIDSGSDMVTDALLDRIIAHRETYRERNNKKEAKELNFLKSKDDKKVQ